METSQRRQNLPREDRSDPWPDPRPDPEQARPVLLGPTDLDDCLRLDGLTLGGFWSRPQWASELEDPRRPCSGLRQGDALVAVACGWLVVDELHITLVAVDPAHRRRGLGRRVLTLLLARACGAGACRATLEVDAANSAALNLYRGCGFRTAGVRRGYYRDGGDALIQWASLNQTGLPPRSPQS